MEGPHTERCALRPQQVTLEQLMPRAELATAFAALLNNAIGRSFKQAGFFHAPAY